MHPFWKGRPGNTNLASARVFNFVHLARHADVMGRHRQQTWVPQAGVPAGPPRWPWTSPWTFLQNGNNNIHLFAARIKRGQRNGAFLMQVPVHCYTLTSSWRSLRGLEKLRTAVCGGWAGEWAGPLLCCVSISLHVHRKWGNEVQWGKCSQVLWRQTGVPGTFCTASRPQLPALYNGLFTTPTS